MNNIVQQKAIKDLDLENLKNTLKEMKEFQSCKPKLDSARKDKMKKEAKMMKEAEKKFERYLQLDDDLGQSVHLDVGIKNKATGEMNYYRGNAYLILRPYQKEIEKGKFITIKYTSTIFKRYRTPSGFRDLLI